jgi:cytochrome c
MILRSLKKPVGRASLLAAAYITVAMSLPAEANHVGGSTSLAPGHKARLILPMMNPERGKELFVSKGCVACHAINGIGGHDAPNMDAHLQMGLVNPFDFAAKMWNHAAGMIYAQEEALGEQIYFTGEELADIIAFVHDDGSQHNFTEADMTERAKKMMKHGHGEMPGPKAHAKELGHQHGPDTPEHAD